MKINLKDIFDDVLDVQWFCRELRFCRRVGLTLEEYPTANEARKEAALSLEYEGYTPKQADAILKCFEKRFGLARN